MSTPTNSTALRACPGSAATRAIAFRSVSAWFARSSWRKMNAMASPTAMAMMGTVNMRHSASLGPITPQVTMVLTM